MGSVGWKSAVILSTIMLGLILAIFFKAMEALESVGRVLGVNLF